MLNHARSILKTWCTGMFSSIKKVLNHLNIQIHCSEWVIIVYHKMSNFSAISWREQVTFRSDDNDDDVNFVLDQHTEMDFYSANSLKQQFTDRHVTFSSDKFPTLKASMLTNTPPMLKASMLTNTPPMLKASMLTNTPPMLKVSMLTNTPPMLKASMLTNTPPMRFCAQMIIYGSWIYTLLCVNLFSVITELIEPKFLFGWWITNNELLS